MIASWLQRKDLSCAVAQKRERKRVEADSEFSAVLLHLFDSLSIASSWSLYC